MKTQLIPLESHDDLVSVRDRMSWAKTPRILLVWPASENISLRPLDLKVLQRHATSLGAQLGLVTRHRDIRREASALGLPVFISTGEAQRVPWPEKSVSKRTYRPPRKNLREYGRQVRSREGKWREYFPVRFGVFVLGVLAVLAVASLFIPQARVTLSPEMDMQSVALPVKADATAGRVSITGSVPLRLARVIVSGKQEMFATGTLALPETKAQGTVIFRNLTDNPVRIPVGTILISSGLPGVRFETVESAQMPGGVNESMEVSIQAEVAGANGNVDADSIQAIEGNLGLSAVVTNPESTSGGKNRLAQAPTDEDRNQLMETLLDQLQVEALDRFENEQASGDEFLKDSVELAQILEERYEPPAGQPGQKLTLILEVEFSAAYISGDDLTELANSVLGASLPPGYVVAETPLEFESQNPFHADGPGVIAWNLSASRRIVKRIDTGQVILLVQGRRVEEASDRLISVLPLRSPPVIQISPAWWPWMPLNPLRYSFEFQ